jgi:Flp pilus assembly protein TadD
VLINLAFAQDQTGDAKGALANLRRATELDPRQPMAFLGLAVQLHAAKDFAGAREALLRARDLAPAHEGVHGFLLEVLQEAKDEASVAAERERWERVQAKGGR